MTMLGPGRGPIAVPVVGGAIAVGGLLARALMAMGFRGGAMTSALWGRLPGWVRQGLAFLGVTIGSEIVIEGVSGGEGLLPGRIVPGSASYGVGDIIDGNQIVKVWVANGVNFVRLANGRLGAQRKDGTWKFWRPRKPIVLYSDGASDIKDYLRADNALDKQAKRLRKSLDRRAPRRRSPSTGVRHTHSTNPSISNIEVK